MRVGICGIFRDARELPRLSRFPRRKEYCTFGTRGAECTFFLRNDICFLIIRKKWSRLCREI